MSKHALAMLFNMKTLSRTSIVLAAAFFNFSPILSTRPALLSLNLDAKAHQIVKGRNKTGVGNTSHPEVSRKTKAAPRVADHARGGRRRRAGQIQGDTPGRRRANQIPEDASKPKAAGSTALYARSSRETASFADLGPSKKEHTKVQRLTTAEVRHGVEEASNDYREMEAAYPLGTEHCLGSSCSQTWTSFDLILIALVVICMCLAAIPQVMGYFFQLKPPADPNDPEQWWCYRGLQRHLEKRKADLDARQQRLVDWRQTQVLVNGMTEMEVYTCAYYKDEAGEIMEDQQVLRKLARRMLELAGVEQAVPGVGYAGADENGAGRVSIVRASLLRPSGSSLTPAASSQANTQSNVEPDPVPATT